MDCPYIPHLFGEQIKDIFEKYNKWLICAVHCSFWPEEDVCVIYNGLEYILRGIRKEKEGYSQPSIVVPIKNDIPIKENNGHEALKEAYKFSSILGWFHGEDDYVNITYHIVSGKPIFLSHGKQPFLPLIISGSHNFNCNFMPIISDENTRKALAFWREGLALEAIHKTYSFVSFYRIMELMPAKERIKWINSNVTQISSLSYANFDNLAKGEVEKLQKRNRKNFYTLLYSECRSAIVHAEKDHIIDPDIPEHVEKIKKNLYLIQSLETVR